MENCVSCYVHLRGETFGLMKEGLLTTLVTGKKSHSGTLGCIRAAETVEEDQ